MSTASESVKDSPLYKRRVNDLMLEGLHALPPAEPIGFFCECPSPDCFTTVWLTRAEYDALRRHPERALLARGHHGTDAGPFATSSSGEGDSVRSARL